MGRCIFHECFVVTGLNVPLLLGRDFLSRYDAMIDFGKATITLRIREELVTLRMEQRDEDLLTQEISHTTLLWPKVEGVDVNRDCECVDFEEHPRSADCKCPLEAIERSVTQW